MGSEPTMLLQGTLDLLILNSLVAGEMPVALGRCTLVPRLEFRFDWLMASGNPDCRPSRREAASGLYRPGHIPF